MLLSQPRLSQLITVVGTLEVTGLIMIPFSLEMLLPYPHGNHKVGDSCHICSTWPSTSPRLAE